MDFGGHGDEIIRDFHLWMDFRVGSLGVCIMYVIGVMGLVFLVEHNGLAMLQVSTCKNGFNSK